MKTKEGWKKILITLGYFFKGGKLVINNEAYDKFIGLMKSYDELLRQHGLVNSYLIEVENAPGHFWHETF